APDAPSSLLINSTSASHLNYTTEDLAMNFLCDDPDSSDTLTYHLTVFNDTGNFQLESSCSDPEYKRVILDNANTSKYTNWSFSVNVSDAGGLYSSTVSSVINLTIENSPPPQVTLNDPPSGNLTIDRTPTFKWNQATDDDGDTLTYDIFVECLPACSIDDREILGDSGSCGGSVCSYTLTEELNYFWDDNDFYNWSVRAYDDEDYGANSTKWNISIQSSVVLSLPNSTIAFGSKVLGEKDNTTDGQPGPFLIQNDGNSIIDVNISALGWLWDTKQTASSYFQYKVDAYAPEPNSFDTASSTTTWTNVPNVNNTFLRWLNHSDSNDIAETDILIEVPLDEPQGDKESIISFTGYYVKIT
ncbi:MAG: hypothetical protein KJ674_03245, partial [Nanoarchaeota archaeon]|nr:hypothetical protein [Nanoarchaeota archaeon]